MAVSGERFAQRLGFDRLPIIDSECDVVPGQADQALAELADALDGDEAAQFEFAAAQVVAGAFEDERACQASHPQRHDQEAAVSELVDPGRGDVRGGDGDDDAVERCMLFGAEFAVCAHDGDQVVITGIGQAPLGAGADVRVDVECDHRTVGTDQLGHERGVVSSRSDLEQPHARFDLSLLQHHRLQPRRRDRADRHPLLIALHDRRVVCICLIEADVRYEQVPGHGPHGLQDQLVDRPANGGTVLDDRLGECLPEMRGSGILVGHDRFSVGHVFLLVRDVHL